MPARPTDEPPNLDAYLLGRVRFTDALALQRRLVYEISGGRDRAALVVCEHPPTVTLGRQGSVGDVGYSQEELDARGWPLIHVNRGDGCMLHAPGQVGVYPVVPLDEFRFSPGEYVRRLLTFSASWVGSFGLPASVHEPTGGVSCGGRLIAQVGVAVRGWVSYFGVCLNACVDLELYRRVRCGGRDEPMTSLQRELRAPVRIAEVRQRALTEFCEQFGIRTWSVLHRHPALPERRTLDAVTTHYRQTS